MAERFEETEARNRNVQELADDVYNVGIGTIQTIEALVDLLLANGVSETDIRQWFGLDEDDDSEPELNVKEWFKQHPDGGGP